MAFVLPVGLDSADGVTPLPVQPAGNSGTPTIVGTPLPTADLYAYSNSGNYADVQEPPGSPETERAEQCTCSHTLQMNYEDARYYWALMPRGTVVTDTGGNIWRMLSAKVKKLAGTIGELSYVMESISFDTPPDEFQINPVELGLNIIKHPRYWWALSPYASDEQLVEAGGPDAQVTLTQVKEAIIRMIQNYVESPFYPSADNVNGLIQNNILSMIVEGKIQMNYPNESWDASQPTPSPVTWDGNIANLPDGNYQYYIVSVTVNISDPNDPIAIALAAAKEIVSKLWRQEDTPYLVGYEVVWTQYFFQPVYLNPGGYIEDPRLWVPDYFLDPLASQTIIPRGDLNGYPNDDTVNAGGGETIFDFLAYYNPQSYSDDGTSNGNVIFSSLRKADEYFYDRTWFKVTHRWLMAPIGAWDRDLYSGEDRPTDANGFNQNPNGIANI